MHLSDLLIVLCNLISSFYKQEKLGYCILIRLNANFQASLGLGGLWSPFICFNNIGMPLFNMILGHFLRGHKTISIIMRNAFHCYTLFSGRAPFCLKWKYLKITARLTRLCANISMLGKLLIWQHFKKLKQIYLNYLKIGVRWCDSYICVYLTIVCKENNNSLDFLHLFFYVPTIVFLLGWDSFQSFF